MHATGDLAAGSNQVASLSKNQREGLQISSNLQRSMNFRRRQSKDMRSNSAKWNKTTAGGGSGAASGTEKSNYEVTSATITH